MLVGSCAFSLLAMNVVFSQSQSLDVFPLLSKPDRLLANRLTGTDLIKPFRWPSYINDTHVFKSMLRMLLIYFWSRGTPKVITCRSNLAQAFELFGFGRQGCLLEK